MNIPDGWEARAYAGRVIASGACTYTELINGSISLKDFFEILRILDWNQYAQRRADALAEQE